jgi:hypothetical protein
MKELAMKTHAFAFVAALATAAVLAPLAVADPPTREPVQLSGTFTLSGLCDFDVQFDVLVNTELRTTFSESRTLITGRLVVRLTNASNTSKSVVVVINGPTFDTGSAESVLRGTSIILGFPGLVLTHGPVIVTPTSFTPTSTATVDLCAVLADP